MRKTFAILVAAGCLAVPMAAHGASTPKSPTCTTLQDGLGKKTFNEAYGKSTSDKKAFNKCASATKSLSTSKKRKAYVKAAKKAVKKCASERKAGSKAFTTKYGSKSTFAKCVGTRLKGDDQYSDPFGG